MKSNSCIRGVILLMAFLFLVSFVGCYRNDLKDDSPSVVPSVTIAPVFETADTTVVGKENISSLDKLIKLNQIISIEEYKLNEYYFEIY